MKTDSVQFSIYVNSLEVTLERNTERRKFSRKSKWTLCPVYKLSVMPEKSVNKRDREEKKVSSDRKRVLTDSLHLYFLSVSHPVLLHPSILLLCICILSFAFVGDGLSYHCKDSPVCVSVVLSSQKARCSPQLTHFKMVLAILLIFDP